MHERGSVEVDIKHAAAGAAEEGDDEAAQPREGHVRRRQARQQKRAPRRAHLIPQLILKLLACTLVLITAKILLLTLRI